LPSFLLVSTNAAGIDASSVKEAGDGLDLGFPCVDEPDSETKDALYDFDSNVSIPVKVA